MPLLSKVFSRSKEKEARQDASHSSDEETAPPPVYSAKDPNVIVSEYADQPPSLTAGFANLRLTAQDSPNRDQCIAHLKLLKCFYRLRQKVGASDGLFGIYNDSLTAANNGMPCEDAEILSLLAEKRWEIYVAKAVDRFERWRDAVAPSKGRTTVSQTAVDGSLSYIISGMARPQGLSFTIDTLPPVGMSISLTVIFFRPSSA